MIHLKSENAILYINLMFGYLDMVPRTYSILAVYLQRDFFSIFFEHCLLPGNKLVQWDRCLLTLRLAPIIILSR